MVISCSDFLKLKEKSYADPMEGAALSLELLSLPLKVLVTFESGGNKLQCNYLKLHFEGFTEKGAVKAVDVSPANKAFVTFKDFNCELFFCL